MHISAKILADSLSPEGQRLTTFQLVFPRFILPEFNTHRVFSKNTSSSRAIPVTKILGQVANDPFMPVYWGQNQAGMRADNELSPEQKAAAIQVWKEAAVLAAEMSAKLAALGVHKQLSNRLTECFQWTHMVMTTTETENFYSLRDHEDAQPEIRALAQVMKMAQEESCPIALKPGAWHLPFITWDDLEYLSLEQQKQVSAARCCRVSYLKHDGSRASFQEDLDLCQKLAGSVPIHASPFEHQATPMNSVDAQRGNLRGWRQYRAEVEDLAKKESQ